MKYYYDLVRRESNSENVDPILDSNDYVSF